MTPLEMAGMAALSGIAAVDAAAAFQVMVGQPVVCGWIAGCLLGQPAAGLWMGISLQLLWSRLAPVGATAYPDVGPATVAGVTVTAALVPPGAAWRLDPGGFLPPAEVAPAVLFGLLAALLLGRFGQFLTVRERRGNLRLAEAADRAARAGSVRGVEFANAAGVARSFARGLIVVLPAVAAAYAIGDPRWRGFVPVPPPDAPANFGLAAFWWFGIAALATVLFRGGRTDWLILAAGLLLGGVVHGVFF